MAQVAHQKDFRWSILWGNVDVPGTGTPDFDKVDTYSALSAKQLPVEGFSFFSLNQNNRRVNRQTGKRHRSSLDTWNDMLGAIPGVTLSMPATKETLDLFLYLALQRVTEAASTPFLKEFQYPDQTKTTFAGGRFPEFSNNEGAFCGLVMSCTATGPWTSQEVVMLGCVPTEVRITCDSDQHDGQLWIEADMIGRFIDNSVTYTGTITAAAEEDTNLFHINNLVTTTILGASLTPIYGFGFTINTGAKFVPYGGYSGGGSKDVVMVINTSGYVDFLVNDEGATTYGAGAGSYQKGQYGNASNLIGWGNASPSADGDLLFGWVGQTTSMTPVGSDEMRMKWEFDCAEYSSNDAFTVDFANALDRSW